MSARKLERLVNLLILLLTARRPVTVAQIRDIVPGYDQPDEDSFRRMFERDKDELRDLGVPIETRPVDVLWEDEVGYLVPRTSYELPPIELEPDEAAAVGLAARLWQSGGAGLAEASVRALLKLRAAGVEADPVLTAGVEPRVPTGDPALEPMLDAVRAGRAVEFDYRGSAAAGPSRRHVEPWGVVHRRGNWYVVGHDTDRGATRVFRLSRVGGPVEAVGPAGAVVVPEGVDLRAEVAALVADPPAGTATVRLAPDSAWEVRQAAVSLADDPDGWSTAEVPLGDVERFVSWVVGFGPDVVVVAPEEARKLVVEHLRAVAGPAEPGGGAR